MCPYDYYTQMRQASDPKHLRLRMVQFANEHGVKAAARAFRPPWSEKAIHPEKGHSYFAETGHYHFAATDATRG